MATKKEELLKVKSEFTNMGESIDVRIKPRDTNTKTKLSVYGISLRFRPYITGNCQLGSISVASRLTRLTIPEFVEFFSKIRENYADLPIIQEGGEIKAYYGKSSLLVDVKRQHVDKLERRFNRINAHKRLKTNYTNRTGSKMTMMVWDLRGKDGEHR